MLQVAGPYQWAGHAFVCLLGSLTIPSMSTDLQPNLVRLIFFFSSVRSGDLICTDSASKWINEYYSKACQRVAVEKWSNITSDGQSVLPSLLTPHPDQNTGTHKHHGHGDSSLKTNKLIFRLGPGEKHIKRLYASWTSPLFHGHQRVQIQVFIRGQTLFVSFHLIHYSFSLTLPSSLFWGVMRFLQHTNKVPPVPICSVTFTPKQR